MQIVKVEPLAKINAIFSQRAGTDEYNIDGFDTRDRKGTEEERMFDWGKGEGQTRIIYRIIATEL